MARRRAPRLTIAEKIAVLETTRALTTSAAAAAAGVPRSTLVSWRVAETLLQQQHPTPRRCRDSTSSGQRSDAHRTGDAAASRDERAPPDRATHANCGRGVTAPRDAEAPGSRTVLGASPETNVAQAAVSSASSAIPATCPVREAPLGVFARTSEAAAAQPARPELGQRLVLVGYVGQSGSLSDVAAREIFSMLHIDTSFVPGSCKTVGYCNALEVMDAVARGEVDYFVAPAEWLLSISAQHTLAESAARPLCIVCEFASKPTLCLCTLPGTELRDCDAVMSDLTLLQTHEALIARMESECGLPIVRHVAWDSAGACSTVQKEHARGVAVLASERAARHAGLCIVNDVVIDPLTSAQTQTRYLVLGRRGSAPLSPVQDSAELRNESLPLRKSTLLASVRSEPTWLATVTRAFVDASVHVVDLQTRVETQSSSSAALFTDRAKQLDAQQLLATIGIPFKQKFWSLHIEFNTIDRFKSVEHDIEAVVNHI